MAVTLGLVVIGLGVNILFVTGGLVVFVVVGALAVVVAEEAVVVVEDVVKAVDLVWV